MCILNWIFTKMNVIGFLVFTTWEKLTCYFLLSPQIDSAGQVGLAICQWLSWSVILGQLKKSKGAATGKNHPCQGMLLMLMKGKVFRVALFGGFFLSPSAQTYRQSLHCLLMLTFKRDVTVLLIHLLCFILCLVLRFVGS